MFAWLKRLTNSRGPEWLSNAPGPSPWYLNAPASRVRTPEGDWTWAHHKDQFGGISTLVSPSGEVVLILDFYCYAMPLPDGQLLIWHEFRKENDSYSQSVIFALLSLPDLVPLEDFESAAAAVRKDKSGFFFKGGAPRTYKMSTVLEEGMHPITPPQAFNGLPEILVLANFGTVADSPHEAHRAIFVYEFARGRVTVLPQVWFNRGGYDFGYQWITRVAREKGTGRIIGDGIRISRFRLDESGTQRDKSLKG
jgi:hypothetical protein